jgi:hypothetical protein
LAIVVNSCGGSDDASPRSTTSTTAATAATAAGAGHGGHDSGSQESEGADGSGKYGSHGMAPKVVTAKQVAELGGGPAVGTTFNGTIGLNVCGRFLDPPVATTSAANGMSTDGTGRFTVTPPDKSAAGHSATINELLQQSGIQLTSGKVTFPKSTSPAQFQVNKTSIAIAGATFTNDFKCGDTKAKVQLWVYSADAVKTGNDVRAVEVDPQNTPIVEDGMAFVVTVTPESSLPTLPPVAVQR